MGTGCDGPDCDTESGGPTGSTTAPIPPELLPRCQIDHLMIPDGDPENGVVGSIEVPSLGPIGRIIVAVRLRHELVSDVRLVLAHDGVEVTVLDRLTCGTTDLEAVFDDEAPVSAEAACMDEIPSVRGFVMPQTPLMPAFGGMQTGGEWTLTGFDLQSGRQGVIESWCLTLTPQ